MAGVYVSYPFCAQKCTYCNFSSGVHSAELQARYVDALIRQIETCQFPWTPETVYLGGGTPSAMPVEALSRVLTAIPGRPWREATIEAAPGSFGPAEVGSWVQAGINRVSLGVQSFDPEELRRTGRRHRAETVARDLEVLRSHNLSNVNLDLITGLPGQTAVSWQASLDHLERLAAPHASVYMLEVDEDSRLGREMLVGGVRYGAGDVPSETQIADLYEYAVERLHAMGIYRYEISNFARPGAESIHNLKYWRLEPYLGFGADAHSSDGGMRWSNIESAQEFAASESFPRVGEALADPERERLFVGLRLQEGIEPSLEEQAALQPFIARGLAERAAGRIRLTDRGVMVSNEIFQELIAA